MSTKKRQGRVEESHAHTRLAWRTVKSGAASASAGPIPSVPDAAQKVARVIKASPQRKEPPMTDLTYPLNRLALDLDTSEEELTARLADRVLIDDWHRPAIDTGTARAMVIEFQDAKRAVLAAEAAVLARNTPAAAPNRNAARVAAIAEAQAARRADGLIGDAFATLEVIGLGEETRQRAESAFDTKADAVRDFIEGRSTGGRYTIRHDEP